MAGRNKFGNHKPDKRRNGHPQRMPEHGRLHVHVVEQQLWIEALVAHKALQRKGAVGCVGGRVAKVAAQVAQALEHAADVYQQLLQHQGISAAGGRLGQKGYPVFELLQFFVNTELGRKRSVGLNGNADAVQLPGHLLRQGADLA